MDADATGGASASAVDAIDAEGEEDVYLYSNEDEMTPSDEDEAEGKKKKAKRRTERKAVKAKDLSEEDYMNYLEAKRSRRRAKQPTPVYDSKQLKELFDEGDDDEADAEGADTSAEKHILQQLQQLRQSQLGLLSSSADAAASADDDAAAHVRRLQEETKRFIFLYGQLLRIRVALQQCVCRGLRLPPYYAKRLFTSARGAAPGSGGDEADRVLDGAVLRRAYDRVTARLQGLLTQFYQSATQQGGDATKAKSASASKKRKVEKPSADAEADEDGDDGAAGEITPFESIDAHFQKTVKALADPCLSFWGDKLILKQTGATGSQLKSIGQPLPVQIKNIIASQMTKMRHKVQKNNAHLVILGHPIHFRANEELPDAQAAPGEGDGAPATRELYVEARTKRAQQIAEGDFDAEIFNDELFLKELVHKSGGLSAQLEQQLATIQTQQLQEQQQQQHASAHPSVSGSRVGFHKFTKGKQIQYEPRSKLVGFMVKESFDDTGRSDVIVQHLFQ
ncbi:protein AATF/BFR2 [Strigomonas culicis]|nr:protein AATF/BFR2 [Strigomonas culicis]|eukprot:EPY21961.1 protein AATF/BFR2 [Strigomonas culicis]